VCQTWERQGLLHLIRSLISTKILESSYLFIYLSSHVKRVIHISIGCQFPFNPFMFNIQERKKIVKGLKGTVGKTAHFQYGSLVNISSFTSTCGDGGGYCSNCKD
jgi:hypothetical protein